MTIRLTQTTHGPTSHFSGLVVDDQGRAGGWQTSGDWVGRSGRDLTEEEQATLTAAIDAAAPHLDGALDPDPEAAIAPAGTTEQLVVDHLGFAVIDHESMAPDLADLVWLLRALQEDLGNEPVAGVELVVAGSPLEATLRHVGTESMEARIPRLTVTATQFGDDSSVRASSVSTIDDIDHQGPVDAGWVRSLVPDLKISLPDPGGFATVTLTTFAADVLGDGVLRSAELGVWIE